MLYSAYGLTVDSAFDIPGLPLRGADPLAEEAAIKIDSKEIDAVHLGRSLIYPRDERERELRPGLTAWRTGSGSFHLTYEDGAEFLIDEAGVSIRARWPTALTLDDVATYLTGPILGFAVRRRGGLALHSSVVEVDRSAIAIVGPPGAGKSTLAAAFSRAGYGVLSDDVAAVAPSDEAFVVQSGYPRLRLWPRTVAALYGSAEALPRITPSWDKRHLDLASRNFVDQPRRLAAVYALSERGSASEPCRIEEVSAREKLIGLVANTYAGHLLDPVLRRRELEQLTRLVDSVPVRRLKLSADFNRIAEACGLIHEDAARLRRRPACGRAFAVA